MHTSDSLLDLHTRTHRSLQKLLRHCRRLSAEELHRELPGFGFATVQRQLFHIFDCEDWWMGGVTGLSRADSRPADFPEVKALDAFRRRVAAMTADYLRTATVDDLNTARTLRLGGKRGPALRPAQVFLHAMTHAFHHKGQAVAMCRLLGYPPPDTDLPVR
jgi:uncharacterized damage-inducible protein DinB